MGEFNSDEQYIYYCGQESLRKKWNSPYSQKKSLKCSTWMQSQKWQHDLCSFPRQTIQYHSNPSLCPDHECWRSWSWTVLWRLIKPSRTDTQKYFLFHYRRLECKSRKSRDTLRNRKVWPWSEKWSRAKTNKNFAKRTHLSKQSPSSNNTREDSTHEHHPSARTPGS